MGRRLQNLNGWQRIWFATTIIAWLFFSIPYGFYMVRETHFGSSTWYYRSAIDADYNSEKCDNYINLPVSELRKPEYSVNGGTCYHIYSSRTTDASKWGDVRPYTQEVYHAFRGKEYWSDMLITLGIFTMFTSIASGLFYLMGWTVAWIRRGFAK